jgi:hypothetical protein
MNADSSRSHSVFIITTEQTDTSAGVKKLGRLYLVDLAGSETVSKTNASGQTLQVRTRHATQDTESPHSAETGIHGKEGRVVGIVGSTLTVSQQARARSSVPMG